MGVSESQPLSRQYLEDEKWLDGHYAELMKQHPDQWVAVFRGRVVAAGKNGADVERVGQRVAKEGGEDYCLCTFVESRFRFYSR